METLNSNQTASAADAIGDRTLIKVSQQVYTRFVARLEVAPHPNDRLLRTMRAPPPWKEPA